APGRSRRQATATWRAAITPANHRGIGQRPVLPFGQQIKNGDGIMERISTTGGMPKITMPSMPKCYLRQRVFARLNHLASCGLIWISAPAGYGKTTAASNYLRDLRRPTIWYQCDEDDADLGSFFHYLTLARKSLHEGALPAFAPQYMGAVPTFCRNFFRHWFAGLPSGSTLVLDNWQDVPSGAALTAMLPIIAEQVTPQVQ